MAFGESLYAGSLVILPIDSNMLALMVLNPLGKLPNVVSLRVVLLVLFFFFYNDIPNCSDKLSFRIFADDTNIFASSPNASELQKLINQELSKVKEWKTNYI